MTRDSVRVEAEFVEQVRRLTNSRTKREAIELALNELLQRRAMSGRFP